MTGQLRIRLGMLLVVGAVWLGAMAAPAAAAGVVRYVDDNPNATACHGTNRHSIQNTINASNPGDTILVCPGTYDEELVIDVPNLTLMSSQYRKAHLTPPEGGASSGVLVAITANGVSFRGFKIEFEDGDVEPSGVPESCATEVAIVITSARAKVIGNHIDTLGPNTLSGECGYLFGIAALGEGPFASAAPALGSNRLAIKKNYIRDFKFAGIFVEGELSARILRNAVRYVHRDDPATCVPVDTFTGAVPQLAPPCETPDFELSVVTGGGIFFPGIGIGAGFGALVDVNLNTVFSTLDFDQLEEQQAPLFIGILLSDAAPGSRITENVVTQVLIGIAVDAEVLTAEAQSSPAGGLEPAGHEISFNRANEGLYGILVDSDSNYIYSNRTRLNIEGLLTFDGENNEFIENDSRYNFDEDCVDETTGTGTAGTANTWEGNIGYEDDPEGICTDPNET